MQGHWEQVLHFFVLTVAVIQELKCFVCFPCTLNIWSNSHLIPIGSSILSFCHGAIYIYTIIFVNEAIKVHSYLLLHDLCKRQSILRLGTPNIVTYHLWQFGSHWFLPTMWIIITSVITTWYCCNYIAFKHYIFHQVLPSGSYGSKDTITN